MTIKEFVAKLKEAEGATATERSETLRELVKSPSWIWTPSSECPKPYMTPKTAEKSLATTRLTTRQRYPNDRRKT